MKWYEYIIARTFMKTMDEADKRRKKDNLHRIRDTEVIFDKGYWHFDVERKDYIFVEPKKNEHFVTTEVNDQEKTCCVILSKKPLTIQSEKFDYPWDAEGFCITYISVYRNRGYQIKVKREAPIVVADYDICCPHCLLSSPFRDWARNSYKQELLTSPEKLATARDHIIQEENLKITDIATEKLWCPMCTNGIEDRKFLITKGDEWKASKLNDAMLPKYTSPYMNSVLQKQKADTVNAMTSSNNEKRNSIKDPFSIVTNNEFGGLVVKGIEKVKNKNGMILKPRWLQLKNDMPSNFELLEDVSTSYFVKTNVDGIPKRNKNNYPLIYVPLSDLIMRSKKEDNKALQQAMEKFHAGEQLDSIRITPQKAIIFNDYLAQLAYELGLSHVPVIVIGDSEQKKAIEEQYKDKVKIEQQQEKLVDQQTEENMVKAFGTFIKKGDRLFRTKAYIQWGQTDNILGTVIMLNPGSAKLQEDRLTEDTAVRDEITIDPTMESLIKLIEELYENKEMIQGRLYIYNLFPLQNAKSKEAVQLFDQLWNENEPLIKFFPEKRNIVLEQLRNSPWVLLGWGCGKRSEHLNLVKKEWLSLVKQSGVPIIGKMGKTDLDFYHPRPRLQSQQIEYRKELKVQYNQLLNARTESDTKKVKGIQDASWKRHVMHYKPVEEFLIGKYKFLLFSIYEESYVLNYKYRLICFIEDVDEPILALNHESSLSGTCMFGASVENGHINLGTAPPMMSLLAFRKWALLNVSDFIKDLDSKLIYDKINNYDSIILDEPGPETKHIDELMKKRNENIVKKIREYDDRYEYCYIMDYEEKYTDFDIHAIPFANIQVVLLEVDDQVELVSIEFLKSDFTIEQVIAWIQEVDVYFGGSMKAVHTIEGCHQVLQVIKFKGNILALYIKGSRFEVLNVDEFPEITETYNLQYRKTDTTNSKKLQHGLTILLNGEIVKEVPHIEFHRQRDIIISNGHLVKADYIDDFEGGVGFYRYDDKLPIASIMDHQTTVHIDLYEREDNIQLCIVEHKYVINFEV